MNIHFSNQFANNYCLIKFNQFDLKSNFVLLKKALLEISQPITFSRTVQPICISNSSSETSKNYDHEAALIAGWGNLAEEFEIGNFHFKWNFF